MSSDDHQHDASASAAQPQLPPSHGPDDCPHAWIPTDVDFLACGKTWQQGKQVEYCPACGRWRLRTVMFLDGDFFKTHKQAQAADAANRTRAIGQLRAWLAQHYPQRLT